MLPLTEDIVLQLRAGDEVLLTGWIYTARDAAHKKMIEELNLGKEPPFDLLNQVIYYAGPSPTPPGKVIGSIGPTTSSRMDRFTPFLLSRGLRGMIGKGSRSEEVMQAIVANKSVYFAALGGAAALQAQSVEKVELVAYEELASEAIRRLFVRDMAVYVAADCFGGCIYSRE
jgi:fumarate hydratase subunit beta